MLKERCDPNFLNEDACVIANICGWTSSFIWFIVLFPQIVLNYKRKSVEGISLLWALLNFLASFTNFFFVWQNNLPIFGRISSIYMPTLEYAMLFQFYLYHKAPNSTKNIIFFSFSFVLILLFVTNYFYSKFYIDYLEWCAIVLWSIETFPQIYLNFYNSSTQGLSQFGQFLAFFGKTTDVISNFTLSIPKQYRILAFFSTSSAYIGYLQVIYYKNSKNFITCFNKNIYRKINSDIEENTDGNPKITKDNNFLNKFIFVFILAMLAFVGIGFICRLDYIWLSSPLVFIFYTAIICLYLFAKKNSQSEVNE